MITQTALLVALGLAVIILSVLLVTRLFAEKRHRTALHSMGIAEFSDFLRTNSLDGKILIVAAKVSEVLKGTCGCEKIIFLRKQRGMLELNYYFGISRFNRSEFRVKFTPEIARQLRTSFVPQKLADLRPFLPAATFERIAGEEFDRYFPIFWRDNLYGVYFIKSNPLTATAGFEMVVAGLAHSLSAAYHVRWHENRYEKLQQRQSLTEPVKTTWPRSSSAPTHQILKLVRHRNSETILPRLLETVQKELGAQRLTYIYQAREGVAELHVHMIGGTGEMEALPPREVFNGLMSELTRTGLKAVNSLANQAAPYVGWVQELRKQGYQYLAVFSLSESRRGLLALEGKHLPIDLGQRLKHIEGPVQDLFNNAESFEQLEELSFTDNLTGLANQRYFRRRLDEEINRARRYKRTLALIMFDLDELKGINDTYGHLAGDSVLSQLGPLLRNSIRTLDILARYGGDEFCIIMPEADGPMCSQFMQRIQATIADAAFSIPEENQQIKCTISVGGAIFPEHSDNAERLIFAADMALLKAKAQGRNQSVLYCPDLMVGTSTEH